MLTFKYAYINTGMHLCIYVCMYVCMYVFMYTYLHIYIYIYIYTYTYIHIPYLTIFVAVSFPPRVLNAESVDDAKKGNSTTISSGSCE
jgi:hypothetical protein